MIDSCAATHKKATWKKDLRILFFRQGFDRPEGMAAMARLLPRSQTGGPSCHQHRRLLDALEMSETEQSSASCRSYEREVQMGL